MTLLTTPLPRSIGTAYEPLGAGEREPYQGYHSDTERDAAIRQIQAELRETQERLREIQAELKRAVE